MSKKRLTYSLFLIFPILLIITAVYLNTARGPYWMGANHDPEYVYLLNSLNMAHGEKIGHIDHPGTPVQMLGAVTLRTLHFFSAPPGKDLTTDVLERSEFYLSAFNTVFVFLNVSMLLIFGLLAYRYTRNIWISLWLQAAPFLSVISLSEGLTRVTPEPLLFFCALLYSLLLVKWLQIRSTFMDGQKPSSHIGLYTGIVLFLGIVTGLGIAAKITFIPLIFAPLLFFPGFKNKILYLGTTLAGFILFTLPIIGSYKKFFDWIYMLLTSKGLYGTRGKGLVSLEWYLGNLKKILLDNPFFTFTLIMASVIIAASLLFPKIRKAARFNPTFKTLVSVFLCQLLGVLLVAKHSLSRYLLPVLLLTGIQFLLQFYYLRFILERFELNEKFKKRFPAVLFTVIAIGAFILVNPAGMIIDRSRFKSHLKDLALTLNQTVENQYRDYARVYLYGSSSARQALNFGNSLAHHLYSTQLSQIYPDSYFYDFIRKQFYGFHHSPNFPLGMIRSKHHNKVVFQGSKNYRFNGLKLKEIAPGPFKERLFLLEPEDTQTIDQLTRWVREHLPKDSLIVTTTQLAGSISELQTDYRILFENFKRMRHLRLFRLASLPGQPYFIVPVMETPGKNSPNTFMGHFKKEAVFPIDGKSVYALGRPESIPEKMLNRTRFNEIKVWHARKSSNVSPALHLISTNGTVDLEYEKLENRNTLRITAKTPGKNNEYLFQPGYRFQKNGLNEKIPVGRIVCMMVTVKVSPDLRNNKNFLFIDDYVKFWKSERFFFPGTGWMTCVIFKKVRENSTGLRMGIRFVPRNPGDELLIRDIKLFIYPSD